MENDTGALEERIRAARHEEERAAKAKNEAEKLRNAENMSVGMRAGTELTGAIGGCAFIGWALDRWLDTAPWLLILMLFLGVCTGFFNVYRLTQNPSGKRGFSGLHKPPKTVKNAPDKKESL